MKSGLEICNLMTDPQKLDLILNKLERIEKALNLTPPSLWDNLLPLYNVKDTAKLLGCSESRVRKYLQFGMLKEVRLERKKMVCSKSIQKVYKDNFEK